MFETFTDIVKTACLALAILLPALGGYWAFRREERRHQAAHENPKLTTPAMAAIGGLLLSENNIERIMQTMHEHAKSVNHLARAIEQRTEGDEVGRRIADRLCDELTALRRAHVEAGDMMIHSHRELAAALLRTARAATRPRR